MRRSPPLQLRPPFLFAELVFFALTSAFNAADWWEWHLGFDRIESFDLFAGEAEPMVFLNQSKMGMCGGADKTDGQSRLPCTAGAADAMGVIHGGARQVEVHHDRKPDDINPAGGEIGGKQHAHVASLEIRERPAARPLAESSVQGNGDKTGLSQLFRDMLGRVLGGDKHENARPFVFPNEMAKQLGAARGIHFYDALDNIRLGRGSRGGIDPHGITEQGDSEVLYRRWKGR